MLLVQTPFVLVYVLTLRLKRCDLIVHVRTQNARELLSCCPVDHVSSFCPGTETDLRFLASFKPQRHSSLFPLRLHSIRDGSKLRVLLAMSLYLRRRF